MKNLFKYLLFVIIGVGVIDVTYRIICGYCYMHPQEGSFVKNNYSFIHCDTPYQLIILGASTAQHSYIPQQIEDSLNISTYNMGWAGRSVLYQYLSLMKAIQNGELETVVLNLSTSQLCDEWVQDRMSDLYPYYWINDTISEMINEVEGKNMDLLLCSGLIQYNSSIDKLLRTEKSSKGYIPLEYTGRPITIKKKKNEITTYNPIAIKYLKKMQSSCKANDIQFVVCLSPDLAITDNEHNSLVLLCKKCDIKVWDMTNAITDLLLYKDDHHLNSKGAELFTSLIIEKLKTAY